MNRKDWLAAILIGVLCTSAFGVGVFVGKKVEPANEVKGESIIRSSVSVTALDVPGVFWIGTGEVPNCPDTHPIKARFDSSTGYFYTPEHKSYTKIKPVLCFATADFAKNKAGFIQKF